jgi:Nucleotidyltransferase of unknown function (DUF6036)
VSGNWDEAAPSSPQQLDADAILRTLLEHKVDFLVIGGLAVAAHGFPRATKDVDIVPAPEPENRRRLYDALRVLGAEPLEIGDFHADELPVPFALDGLDEGGNWALRTTAGRIDVLQWVPGVEESYERLRAQGLDVELPDVGRVRFAGYADLVAMKQAAGRPQDQRDLDELRAIRGDD